MRIAVLHLTDFRNYAKRSIEFSPENTLLVGPNSAGKSNIIEAVYLLANGRSFRVQESSQMVRFACEAAHIIGHVEYGQDETVGLHAVLTGGVVSGKRTATLSFKVDEVGKRRIDFVGKLKVVLFEPESLKIVVGDPQSRRDFLDEVLVQTNRDYVHSLLVYHKSLRVRNRLLDDIREGSASTDTLAFWERSMAKHGALIQAERLRFIDWIDKQAPGLSFEYDASAIDEGRFDQYRQREVAAGFTLIGPQRDEIQIQMVKRLAGYQVKNGDISSNSLTIQPSSHSKALSAFGSRGEQRMAVLHLKLLEAAWIEQETGERPVILLDDIFSELDQEHEKMVGKLVEGRQTIITATEIHKSHYPKAKVVELLP